MFSNLFSTIKKFLKIIDIEIKTKIFFLLFFLILVTIFELLSLGLLPTLVAKVFETTDLPNIVDTFLELFYINNITNLIFFISLIFFIKFTLLLYVNYFELSTLKLLRVLISKTLFKKYSEKSYNFFIQNNSSLLSRNILVEADNFVALVQSIIILLKEFVLLIAIFILLITFEPFLSFSILFIFLLAAMIFYKLTDKKLKSIALSRITSLGLSYKIVNQFLNLIKEIKILKKENFFINKFYLIKKKYEESLLTSNFITRLPKIFFEFIVIVIFLCLMLFLSLNNPDKLLENLPFLSLVVVSIIKLLPSFNGISGALTHFQSYLNSFNLIYEQIMNFKIYKDKVTEIDNFQINSINIKKNSFLEIKDLVFQYSSNSSIEKLVINNLEIKNQEMIGIIGVSGSGKTTLINLILKLLQPNKGKILFHKDFKDLKIGHVPQDIEIFDDTLRNNIAFGVKEEEINDDKVIEVLKKCGLENFFKKNKSNLNLILGDKGIKISGGEKQRIGIARSLYIDPDFLILDEATSSLDIVTEKVLLDEIEKLRGNITTIFVSHRISALKKCNSVYLISSGKIIANGSTEELLNKFPNLTTSKE